MCTPPIVSTQHESRHSPVALSWLSSEHAKSATESRGRWLVPHAGEKLSSHSFSRGHCEPYLHANCSFTAPAALL